MHSLLINSLELCVHTWKRESKNSLDTWREVNILKNGQSRIYGRQLLKIWNDTDCFKRQYHFKFFIGCHPRILFDPLINSLSQKHSEDVMDLHSLRLICVQFTSCVQEVDTVIWLLRGKCPNTKFFLVLIFQYSDWIQRDNPYLSVFSPNAGKYGPEKTPYLDTYHVVD